MECYDLNPLRSRGQQQRSVAERSTLKRADARNSGFTADTPVPYRLADLTNQVGARSVRSRASAPRRARSRSRLYIRVSLA